MLMRRKRQLYQRTVRPEPKSITKDNSGNQPEPRDKMDFEKPSIDSRNPVSMDVENAEESKAVEGDEQSVLSREEM